MRPADQQLRRAPAAPPLLRGPAPPRRPRPALRSRAEPPGADPRHRWPGPAVYGRAPPGPAVTAEARLRGGDAQVGPERELAPAGARVTFDRSDHGLGEQHARGSDGPIALGAEARYALGMAGA